MVSSDFHFFRENDDPLFVYYNQSKNCFTQPIFVYNGETADRRFHVKNESSTNLILLAPIYKSDENYDP